MSPDDVLAANLWAWPDPLLKRDRAGHVIFVNAAFLGLYGGRVQDWQGKPVHGWPAPNQAGAQRFETRVGSGANGSVYDWVEAPMSDGNVLAIARNVTIYAAPPSPPSDQKPLSQDEGTKSQTPTAQKSAVNAPQNAPVFSAKAETSIGQTNTTVGDFKSELEAALAPTQNLGDTDDKTLGTRHGDEHITHKLDAAKASPQNCPVPSREPVKSAPHGTDDVQDDVQNVKKAQTGEDVNPLPSAPQPPKSAPAPQGVDVPVDKKVPTPQPVQSEQQQPERAAERRALPIEDSTSVLGANWRDQVIAKAIGAEEPATTPEPSEGEPETSGEGEYVGDAAKGLRILLAEDNSINALLTRTLLEAEGAVVDTVEDGALAVEAVKKQTYDLIFMDMRMPNMDGLEATRKIRAYGSKLPIIALTANAFDDDRNACFDSGMNDFMTKPVSAEELIEMVNEWTKPENRDRSAA